MARREPPLLFPESLCYRCAAPRLVRTGSSVFILCPLVPAKYPRQPVLECQHFRPKGDAAGIEGEPEGGAGGPGEDDAP